MSKITGSKIYRKVHQRRIKREIAKKSHPKMSKVKNLQPTSQHKGKVLRDT